ncbi:SsgA family sporulation/cell division regulator [Streptomyces sp. NPDC090025]|uniref:SsgA family sporulation/cell division regulator n=1 Tax=Streptomyces sp. NPDC090025 TaxID=3365922 RepID=UPI003839AC42
MESTTARSEDGTPDELAPHITTLVFPMEAWGKDEWVPVSVFATYSTATPYEVGLEFLVAGRSAAYWVFARDLLLDGSVYAAGSGDVWVWTRAAADGRPERVHLLLDNGSERCLFVADHRHAALWCAMMTSLVPRGEESRHLDLDGAVDRLLSG